jgi:hypothetical protein
MYLENFIKCKGNNLYQEGRKKKKEKKNLKFIEYRPLFVAKLANKTLDSDYKDLMGAMVEA